MWKRRHYGFVGPEALLLLALFTVLLWVWKTGQNSPLARKVYGLLIGLFGAAFLWDSRWQSWQMWEASDWMIVALMGILPVVVALWLLFERAPKKCFVCAKAAYLPVRIPENWVCGEQCLATYLEEHAGEYAVAARSFLYWHGYLRWMRVTGWIFTWVGTFLGFPMIVPQLVVLVPIGILMLFLSIVSCRVMLWTVSRLLPQAVPAPA